MFCRSAILTQPEEDILALSVSLTFQVIWNHNGTSDYSRICQEHSPDIVNIEEPIVEEEEMKSMAMAFTATKTLNVIKARGTLSTYNFSWQTTGYFQT